MLSYREVIKLSLLTIFPSLSSFVIFVPLCLCVIHFVPLILLAVFVFFSYSAITHVPVRGVLHGNLLSGWYLLSQANPEWRLLPVP